MSPVVLSATKPAVPWRGPVIAFLLLLGSCALAGWMVYTRGSVRMVPARTWEGWSTTFDVPVDSILMGHAYYERWQMAQYSVPLSFDQDVKVLYWERPVESGVSSETLAEAVLAMTAALSGRLLVEAVPLSESVDPKIGAIDAFEVWSQDSTVVARAAVDGSGALAVSLVSDVDVRARASVYERFEATCRSMRPISGGEIP